MNKLPSSIVSGENTSPGLIAKLRSRWTSDCIDRHKKKIARVLEKTGTQPPEGWSTKYDYLLGSNDLVKMYQDANLCIEKYGRENIRFVAGFCLERVGANGKREVYLVQNVAKSQKIGPHNPGGSCNSGEGLVDGLVREVREETDIRLQEAFGLGKLQYNLHHVDSSSGENLIVFEFTPKNLSRKEIDELVSCMTFEHGEEDEGWWESDILAHPAVPRIPGQTFDKFRHLGRNSPFTKLLTPEEQREDLQNGCPREYVLYRAYTDGITHIVDAYVGITEANKNKPESWDLSNYYDYEKLDKLIPTGIQAIESAIRGLLPNHPEIDEFLNKLFIPNFRKQVIERIVELGRLRDIHLRKLHGLGPKDRLYSDFSDFVGAIEGKKFVFQLDQFCLGDVSEAHAHLGRCMILEEQFIRQLFERSGVILDFNLSHYKNRKIQICEGHIMVTFDHPVGPDDTQDPDYDPMIGKCIPWSINERTVIHTIRVFPDFSSVVEKEKNDLLH